MRLLPYAKQYKNALAEYPVHLLSKEQGYYKMIAKERLKKKIIGANGKINWWKVLINLGYVIAQLVVQWLSDKLEDEPLEV